MTYADNTLRIGEVNTRCIDTFRITATMTQTKAERLRAVREKAGYTSAQAAAEAFGWGVAGYRHHENGTRGFGPDAAKKYGRAFKVKPGWLLGMEGIDGGATQEIEASPVLHVGASVAAGVWKEAVADAEILEIDTPPPVQNVKRFGYRVEGRSMDLVYEPGTVLDCISIFTNGVAPRTGDHVIVERRKPDGLRELTVKEYCVRDGKHYLLPRSTQPEFQSEMEIGAPSEDMSEYDEHIQVIAFVVSSIAPRQLNLLDRLGKVRRIRAG